MFFVLAVGLSLKLMIIECFEEQIHLPQIVRACMSSKGKNLYLIDKSSSVNDWICRTQSFEQQLERNKKKQLVVSLVSNVPMTFTVIAHIYLL